MDKRQNYLEIWAIGFALCSLQRLVEHSAIALLMDNTKVLACVVWQEGTISRSLCTLATRIWTLCLDRDSFLVASHLPGTQNVLAYCLSREEAKSHEWDLNWNFLLPIFYAWGHLNVDGFTIWRNKNCPVLLPEGWGGPNILGEWSAHSMGRQIFVPFCPCSLFKLWQQKPIGY